MRAARLQDALERLTTAIRDVESELAAPIDVRFPRDVWQILLARNPQHGISDRCRQLRAGAPANDVRALLHVCATAQICARE
jgi:hypothetical protein